MKQLLSCFFILSFIFGLNSSVFAYDVRIDSIVATPASCGSDGSATIYLGGTDASSLTSVVYVVGSKVNSFNTVYGLFPGTYTVAVSGLLGTTAVNLSGTVTIGGTTSYVSLNTQIVNIRNSMPAMSTGKVTLNITQGKLPYTIEVWDGSTLITTETYTTVAPNYVVGNIPAGTYTIKVSDGCTNSYLSVIVPVQNPAFYCNYISLNLTSQSDGTVQLSTIPSFLLNEYYSEHRAGTDVWWEYSYTFDGGAYTPWTDLPQDGIINDVINTKYCDVWGKAYTIRIRVKGGDGTVVCNQDLIITGSTASNRDYVSISEESGCVKDTFVIFSVHGNYYSPPLNMKITNTTKNQTLYDNVYVENTQIKITSDMRQDTLLAVFTDAKGCVFENTKALSPIEFDYWYLSATQSPCQTNSIGVYFRHNSVIAESISASQSPPEGTIVELISAPDPQLCFKAMYNRASKTWDIIPSGRLDVITQNTSVYLTDTVTDISDTRLPSGKYTFRISDSCGYEKIFESELDFYRYRVIEPLHIDNSQFTCDGMMYFPVNKVERYRYTASGYEPGEIVESYFDVSSSDGGNVTVTNGNLVNTGYIVVNPLHNGQTQNFTISAVYNDFRNCSLNSVTINYQKRPAVSFKDIIAYRCLGAKAIIIATADSTTGIQPYKYTVYSASEVEIESNTTGIFEIDTTENDFIVKLTDGCNLSDAAYTETMQNLSMLNIGVDRIILGKEYVCLGENETLVSRLNAGTCEWTRPNGNVETGYSIEVSCEDENNLEIGWYKLKITGLDCEVNDSILVGVEYPFNDTIYIVPICDSELPYKYDGHVFQAEGFYTFYNTSINGCDSTTTYHFMVHPTYRQDDTRYICETILPYAYSDTIFDVGTQTGLYTLYRKTIHGCDSIIDLQLVVGEDANTVFNDTIFKYENYERHNFYLPSQTTVGDIVFVQNHQTYCGCDSTVILNLTVLPIVKSRIISYNAEPCGDAEYFLVEYEIDEGPVDSYSIRFSEKALNAGFIDVTNEPAYGSDISITLPNAVRPNKYSMELMFENIHGYVDTHTIDFAVLYPSSIILQMWNDVLALLNSTNNGGYEFTAYQWYKNGQPLIGEKQSYVYTGQDKTLDMGVEYKAELTRLDDGVTLFTCPFMPTVHQDVYIYPTLLAKSQIVTVKANSKGVVNVWSLSGTKYWEQNLGEGNNSVLAPSRSGIYLFDVIFDNGVKVKQLIVVQ